MIRLDATVIAGHPVSGVGPLFHFSPPGEVGTDGGTKCRPDIAGPH
jgi:hypothetical protein